MNILLTNDDGIHAPGIHAMYRRLVELGDVCLAAPERPRSAAGHAITLHKPLRLVPTTLPGGIKGYGCSGTPSDCVSLAVEVLLGGKCDLVVSGINAGSNLGWDLTYSGTVAAAIEAAILYIPSIAVSVTLEGTADGFDFDPAARFVVQLAKKLLADPMPPNTLLNVNVPAVPASEITGVEITRQGTREYVDRVDTRTDPTGRAYYWLGGSLREETPDPGSDVHAILEKRISVTPVRLDMTDYSSLERLSDWNLA